MFPQRISFVFASLCLAGGVGAVENAAELAPLRVALVGDSTVASYPTPPADRPGLTGWGQVFDEFLCGRVTVLNHAVSGHSSKSFIREGLWRKTLEVRWSRGIRGRIVSRMGARAGAASAHATA